MAKVDWITWKTDPKDIIDPKIVEEKIDEYYQNYNTYINPVVYEGIKHEVLNGGLDKASLNIIGYSPANESAINILNDIDEIKSIIENIKREVVNSAEEQRQVEKLQLIEAIKNKIIQQEEMKEISIRKDPKEAAEITEFFKERIRRLEERLAIAKSL